LSHDIANTWHKVLASKLLSNKWCGSRQEGECDVARAIGAEPVKSVLQAFVVVIQMQAPACPPNGFLLVIRQPVVGSNKQGRKLEYKPTGLKTKRVEDIFMVALAPV
jgi:hypothetical protein